MTRAQALDLRDELVELAESLNTLLSGVDMDDAKLVKPLVKISGEITAFAAKLDEVSQQ